MEFLTQGNLPSFLYFYFSEVESSPRGPEGGAQLPLGSGVQTWGEDSAQSCHPQSVRSSFAVNSFEIPA